MYLATLLSIIVGVAIATPVVQDSPPTKVRIAPRQSAEFTGNYGYCCKDGERKLYVCDFSACSFCPADWVCYYLHALLHAQL